MALIDVSTRKYPGLFAAVDDSEVAMLSKWKWGVSKSGDGRFYVRRQQRINGKQTVIYLHKALCPSAKKIDHIDGDTLNNRRNNLRECSASQNAANSKKRIDGVASAFKGVKKTRSGKRWVAMIRVLGRSIYLGTFDVEKHAALAYDAAARSRFGEFARTNFR
jgi:hypothetical protein